MKSVTHFKTSAAFILIILSLLLTLDASARGPAQRRRAAAGKVTQSEVVRFPRLGAVRVRAVEARGRVPRLEFSSEATGRRLAAFALGTSSPESYKPMDEPGVSLIDPFVRFMELRAEGLPAPLVLAVAVRPGGSDHGFETTIFGEAGGRLRALTPTPLLNPVQGGVFVGDLGGGRGPGAAAWEFIWDDDEAHYDRHRYAVRLYRFDARTNTFRRGRVLRSKNKHARAEDALEELGLPRYTNLLDNFPAIKDYRS